MLYLAAATVLDRVKLDRWLLLEIGGLTFVAITLAFDPSIFDQDQHSGWIVARSVLGIGLAFAIALTLVLEQAAEREQPADAASILGAALLGVLTFMFPVALSVLLLMAYAVLRPAKLIRR